MPPREPEMGFEVQRQPESHAKLGASPAALASLPTEGDLLAAVSVTVDGYIPHGIEVRERFGPRMFTASVPAAGLTALLDDPRVEQVEPSRPLCPDRRGA